MRKNPQIFWTFLLLGLVVIIWGFFAYKNREDVGRQFNFLENEESKTNPLPLGEGQEVKTVSFGSKEYSHKVLGFSFEYSKDYSISSFGNYFDSNGETVLLQKEKGVQGLQILITPFDENIDLTVQKIKKDLPSLSMSEEKEVKIGGGNTSIQAVVFRSGNNLSVGKSIEAWFVYNKNLYQISSTEESEELFDIIIKTWKQTQ